MKILCKPNICMAMEFATDYEQQVFRDSLWFKNPNPTRFDLENPYYTGMVSLFLDPVTKQKFASGFLGHVLQFMAERGIVPRIEVARPMTKVSLSVDPGICDGVTLRPYQVDAVNTALRLNRGLVTAPPRSGKTLMQAALAKTLDRPSVIFVQRTSLLDQHVENLRKWGLDPGVVQGSVFEGGDKLHCVAMLQTVWNNYKSPKYAEWLDRVDVMQIDEVHHAASADTFYKAALSCPASWRLGYSGTPFSLLDLKENKFNVDSWRLVGLCGQPIVDITTSQLRDAGLMTPLKILQIKQTLPDMSDVDGNDWHAVYTKGVVDNELRNRQIVSIALKAVEAGRTPLVLVKYIEHGNNLFEQMRKEGLIPVFSRGGKNISFCQGTGVEASRGGVQDAYKMLLSGQANIMLATQIADEGVDLPSVDALILAVGGKADQVTTQRIFRPMTSVDGKSSAVVVDFDDRQHGVLRRQSETRRRVYRLLGFEPKMVGDVTVQDLA